MGLLVRGYFAERGAAEKSLASSTDPWQRASWSEDGSTDVDSAINGLTNLSAASGTDGERGTSEERGTSGAAWTRFSDPRYGFSLDHPASWRHSNVQDDEYGGEVFLFEGPGAGEGFQIFLSPFDEPLDVLTPERIREDVPAIAIENPQVVVVGQGGQFRALIFFSNDESLGRTREVWFIHEGYLYQLTVPAGRDAEIARVMGTWEFE